MDFQPFETCFIFISYIFHSSYLTYLLHRFPFNSLSAATHPHSLLPLSSSAPTLASVPMYSRIVQHFPNIFLGFLLDLPRRDLSFFS